MKYAKGHNAMAECMRSGQKMYYRDLVEDGHIPGLLVHPDWYEPEHPQETPPRIDDPIALYRPSPEISAPDGEGDPLADNTCGVTPNLLYQPSSTLSAALSGGEYFIPVEDAVIFKFGQCVFIQRDDASWFMSTISDAADTPTFSMHLTTAFDGVAAAGNSIYIGATGNGALI